MELHCHVGHRNRFPVSCRWFDLNEHVRWIMGRVGLAWTTQIIAFASPLKRVRLCTIEGPGGGTHVPTFVPYAFKRILVASITLNTLYKDIVFNCLLQFRVITHAPCTASASCIFFFFFGLVLQTRLGKFCFYLTSSVKNFVNAGPAVLRSSHQQASLRPCPRECNLLLFRYQGGDWNTM